MRPGSLIALSRSAIVMALGLGLAAPTANARTYAELKTAQQFQADAAAYDAAIRAISGIGGQRIATQAELQSAMDLFHRHAPAVGFAAARLIVLGYQDNRFTTAIRASLANDRLAQDFARRLVADPAITKRLDGAAELKIRMAGLLQANAAAVQRAIDNLHAATLRITGRSPGIKPKYFAPPPSNVWDPATITIFTAITVTFPSLTIDTGRITTSTTPLPGAYDPFDRAVAAYVSLIGSGQIRPEYDTQISALRGYADQAMQAFYDAYVDAINSVIDSCVARARARYDQCLVEAATLTGDKRTDAERNCEFQRIIDSGMCRLNPSWDLGSSSLFGSGT